MIAFSADFYDGRRSKPHRVRAEVGREAVRLTLDDSSVRTFKVTRCSIDAPLGSLERSVQLEGGAQLVTRDFDAIADWEHQQRSNRGQRFVHRLEQRWVLVLSALLILGLLSWLGIRDGVPWAAAQIAPRIPPEILHPVSEKTLAAMDEHLLDPTTLPPREQMRVEALFLETRAGFNDALDARLHLRHAPMIGANAFALPDGTVIVTDQLVEMATTDAELAGILVHEMAHIQNHHAMRNLLQNTGVFLMISTLLGDVTSISALSATLPIMLVEKGYSRDFEREADDVAVAFMKRRGWGVEPYVAMLNRLDQETDPDPASGYLSTHPETSERIRRLREAGAE